MRLCAIFLMMVCILSSCSNIEKTKDALEASAQVYSEDAFNLLSIAKELNPKNAELHNRSMAQIVFPKVVKGGFIIGGNYAEGDLIENGQIFDQIRMVGGNIGPNIGGQSYSQITYIMNYGTLERIKTGQTFSLQGTANYAQSGESITDIFGQISDGKNLITIIFNQTGYLAGISFDGISISRKNSN